MKEKESETPKEIVLMSLNRTRKAFAIEYACAFFLLSLPIIALFQGVTLIPFYTLVPVTLGIIFAGHAEISRYLHRSQITSNKVLIIDGLLKMRKRHVFISAINDVDTKQSRFQRLFRFGKVHIRTASGEELELKDITKPERVMSQLEDLIQKVNN
jgi:uncharacterized membrane protein YdbT with pleckstrin-like domain